MCNASSEWYMYHNLVQPMRYQWRINQFVFVVNFYGLQAGLSLKSMCQNVISQFFFESYTDQGK